MDPHIFADPDPGSQSLADPTDPDPKHCLNSAKDPFDVDADANPDPKSAKETKGSVSKS